MDHRPTWYGIIADTNFPTELTPWHSFMEAPPPNWQIFKQPSGLSSSAENTKNLPVGYYQRLAIGKSPEWKKVYISGEYGFITDGKPVWPEYNDQVHCPPDKAAWPKVNPSLPIVRSYDFGLTPACIFSQITSRGQWIVFDEIVATRMGTDSFSDTVLDHCARWYPRCDFIDYGDPAGANASEINETLSSFRIMHAKGIMIEPGIQTLEIRLESVRKPLRTLVDGRPQFVLHPRCSKLRRGMMGGYRFRKMRVSGERYTASPEKDQFSHPCDALSYAGTRLFGAALYGMRPNDDQQENRSHAGRSMVTGY